MDFTARPHAFTSVGLGNGMAASATVAMACLGDEFRPRPAHRRPRGDVDDERSALTGCPAGPVDGRVDRQASAGYRHYIESLRRCSTSPRRRGDGGAFSGRDQIPQVKPRS